MMEETNSTIAANAPVSLAEKPGQPIPPDPARPAVPYSKRVNTDSDWKTGSIFCCLLTLLLIFLLFALMRLRKESLHQYELANNNWRTAISDIK